MPPGNFFNFSTNQYVLKNELIKFRWLEVKGQDHCDLSTHLFCNCYIYGPKVVHGLWFIFAIICAFTISTLFYS